jgi:hypothetical protein
MGYDPDTCAYCTLKEPVERPEEGVLGPSGDWSRVDEGGGAVEESDGKQVGGQVER